MPASRLANILRRTNPGAMAELADRGGRIPDPEKSQPVPADEVHELLSRVSLKSTGRRKKMLEATVEKLKDGKRKRPDRTPGKIVRVVYQSGKKKKKPLGKTFHWYERS